MIAPFILESKEMLAHAKEIIAVLDDYGIKSAVHIVPAYKASEVSSEVLKKYDEMKESVVYVSIGGSSSGLTSFVSANTHRPVVSCPPVFDQLEMPTEAPGLFVESPKNAGQAVARLLALTNKDLAKKVKNHIKVIRNSFHSKPIEIND